MTAQGTREIIIEIEKIQLIRKRAQTRLAYCMGCGFASDIVCHAQAAELFETAPADLIRFIEQNNCHRQVGPNGQTWLCVLSLLDRMQQHRDIRRLEAMA